MSAVLRVRSSVAVGLGVLAMAIAGVAGLAASATPTHSAWTNPAYVRAAPVSDTWAYQIRLSGTQLCLDVINRVNADLQGVQIYDCNQSPAQVWTPSPDESLVVFRYTNSPPARCLDVTDRRTAQDVALQIYTCQTTAGNVTQTNQQWFIQAAGAGTVTIRSRAVGDNGQTRCLDVPSNSVTRGTTARVNDCTAANRSRLWLLEPVTAIN